MTLWRKGNTREATATMLKSLELQENLFGSENPELLDTLDDLSDYFAALV